MKSFFRNRPALLIALSTLIAVSAAGQNQAPPPPPAGPDAFPIYWTPQAIAGLSRSAASRTEFTLDHNMLILAAKTDQSDDGMRRIIAGLDGVSVHRFRYQAPGMYDPALLDAVRQEFRGGGWQHVTVSHDKQGGPGATDLWLHFENNTIRNVAVLSAGADHVNFVTVSGSISPIDLFHLAGHFGIPNMQGGVVIPAPSANAAPPPPPADNGPVDYRHENTPSNSPQNPN